MKAKIACILFLFSGIAAAQTINVNQIKPSSRSGDVITTVTAGHPPSWQPGGGGGGGCGPNCVLTNPTATQTVVQPSATTLQSNSFDNMFNASQFGTGSNGIETVYRDVISCIPLGNGIPDGCTVNVPPLYTNADSPQGWDWLGNYYGGNTGALFNPPGASGYDYRDGNLAMYFRDPSNPLGGQSGLSARTDITQNLGTRTYLNGGSFDPTGAMISLNQYAGGWDFLFYPFMPQYVEQNYEFGLNLTMDNWSDGIDFGTQEIMNHHGMGDALLHWERLTCDGGILAGNSEGCSNGDFTVSEDTTVFAGVIHAISATSITVGCNQGCGTEGQDRIVLDTSSASIINGDHATGEVGPQTTGSANNSAVMPPQVIDAAQTFPVSTMFQLCNPGANNGASGAAGCTSGNQPIGVIPPTPLTITVTAGSVTSNVGSFTGTNALVAGQPVILYHFAGSGAPLNNVPGVVSSTGLSTSAFQVALSGSVPDIAVTGTGISTQSPTGFSPPASITLNVVASYTGTGGDTNGLPAGFCTSSTLQSSSSGSSCYLPASGFLYLTDGIEYESDSFTYNSGTQQVTITGMMFPHLNGVVASWGGIAGWAIQDNANLVNGSSGLGVTGNLAPTYAIAGAVSATSVYYIPQRTNEQYGLPTIGISNPSNGNQGYFRQLYFSVTMTSFSISGGTVQFNMNNPPQVVGDLHQYNGLTAAMVVPGNTTYSCTACVLTWVSGNTFKYTPSAPSGSVPTTGTVTYNNAGYSIFPAARVRSVFDTATNQVDGVMQIYPITIANDPIAVNDNSREAHYQQTQITNRHDLIRQFVPSQNTGFPLNVINIAGYVPTAASGYSVVNLNNDNFYLGRGGNWTLPGNSYSAFGSWTTGYLQGEMPDQNLIQVLSPKGVVGLSTPYSNVNVLNMPTLISQGAQPGANDHDCLNYDPNANSATRSAGTDSGTWYFDNCFPIATVENSQQAFGHVRMGYANVDQGVTANNVTAKNIFTTQSTSMTIFANPVTTGSTATNYWVVGHAAGGGTTVAIAAPNISNGAATPNNQICMPYQSKYSSYDVYRGSTSNLIATGVVVNGLSVTPVQPANYACLDDTNLSPSTSPAPSSNTTGGVNAAGPLTGLTVQETSVNVAGCATFDSSGNLTSTGSVCGSGGGGSGTVTNVAATVPGWMSVSGSPITTTGTLAFGTVSQAQNQFLASPNGSSGVLGVRALVAADIPNPLNQNTTGQAGSIAAGTDSSFNSLTLTSGVVPGEPLSTSSTGVIYSSGAYYDCSELNGGYADWGLQAQACFAAADAINANAITVDLRGVNTSSTTASVNPCSASTISNSGLILFPGGLAKTNIPCVPHNAWSVQGVTPHAYENSGYATEGSILQAGSGWKAKYTTGTVSFGTLGVNEVITGSGTSWLANVVPGEVFVSPPGGPNHPVTYGVVQSVNSNTSITLNVGMSNTGTGQPASGSNYVIWGKLFLHGGGDPTTDGSEFGIMATNMAFDCANMLDCDSEGNWFAGQHSGDDNVYDENFQYYGLQVEGLNAQNSHFDHVWASPGTRGTATTIPIYIGLNQGFMGFNDISANKGTSSVTPNIGVDLEGSGLEVNGVDAESVGIGVDIYATPTCNPACAYSGTWAGPANGITVNNVHGSGTTALAISQAFGNAKNIVLTDIGTASSSFTNTLTDTFNSCTIPASPDFGLAQYVIDINGNIAVSTSSIAACRAAMNVTSLLASGTVSGKAPSTITTTTTATLGGTYNSGYTYNQEATAGTAVAYTLPVAAAGKQFCVGNSYNGSAANTGALTLQTSGSGQFIIFTDGTLSASGGYVISSGAAADFACVVGVDATHWYLRPGSGTWVKH